MSDEQVNTYIQEYRDIIAEDVKDTLSPERFERTLRHLIKEVQRDARHSAVQIINSAANAVMNL